MAAGKISIKRVYEPPAQKDGRRILVDRIWPRGLAKSAAQIDEWMKDAAPSSALRKWFGHDPEKWNEFQDRFFTELDSTGAADEIAERAKTSAVCLVFAARDHRHNNAAALKRYIEERCFGKPRNPGGNQAYRRGRAPAGTTRGTGGPPT